MEDDNVPWFAHGRDDGKAESISYIFGYLHLEYDSDLEKLKTSNILSSVEEKPLQGILKDATSRSLLFAGNGLFNQSENMKEDRKIQYQLT